MATVVNKKFHINTAKNFKTQFSSNTDGRYIALGKTDPWANESAPETPTDVQDYGVTIRNGFFTAKKIGASDVTHVIRRDQWSANTVYFAFDNTIEAAQMFDNVSNKMVVINANNDVYKCISNNYGANSTVEPTSQNTSSVVATADGYKWKYLFTVVSADVTKFLSSAWVPVKTLSADDGSLQWDVQQNAIQGTIENLLITSGGAGYANGNGLSIITITGDGSNATATANVVNGAIVAVNMTNIGHDYTLANVFVTGANTNTAVVRAVVSPLAGHGADPVEELGASAIMIALDFNNTTERLFDYRRATIWSKPYLFGTNTFATGTLYNQSLKITVTAGAGSYSIDETVYQGAALANAYFTATVTGWDSTNNVLTLTNTIGTPNANTVFGNTTGTVRTYISKVDPELDRYSGNLLYSENRMVIEYANNETVSVKTIIKF